MQNQYTYRSMTEADISTIALLEPNIFPSAPYSEETLRGYYNSKYSRVAFDSTNSIVAYVFAKPRQCGYELWIGNIGVLPAHNGKGIATELMSHLCTQAEGEHLTIGLQVEKTNQRAKNIYIKFGFENTRENGDCQVMSRTPKLKLIWLVNNEEHKHEILRKLTPHNLQDKVIVIVTNGNWESEIPDYNPQAQYQLIISGGHGDFRNGRPTQLNGASNETVQKWVSAFNSKQFKFHHILLHSCLSAGFIPLFSELTHQDGLIYANILTCITTIFSLLDKPFELLSNFQRCYLSWLATTIDNRDTIVNGAPFIAECIFIKSINKIIHLHSQNIKADIAAFNLLGNSDTLRDYKGIMEYLKRNQIDTHSTPKTLCDLMGDLEALKEQQAEGVIVVPANSAEAKNSNIISPIGTDNRPKLNQYSFLSRPINIVNLSLTCIGLSVGITSSILATPIAIGLSIIAATLFLTCMLALISHISSHNTSALPALS